MKNLSIVFLALLILASCRKKGEEPIAVEGVSLPAKASVVVNGTHELKATVSPPNAADKSLTWDSDSPKFATVDQNGVVTGKAEGTAVITATSKSNPDKSAKCEVQVMKEKVASITIAPEKPEVVKGSTRELKATVLPASAAQTVTWSSKDPDKATVDPNTGVVTGKEAGTAVITATATDGSEVKGEVTLTVRSEPAAAAATITDITLGTENFVVAVPTPGQTTTLNNAPHTIFSDPAGVQVNITATTGAVIKIGIGGAAFTSGNKVPFNPSVTFSVTEEGKVGSKEYTLTIPSYTKESNPYGIYTLAHLHDVRNALGAGFKLMNDLTMPAVGGALPEITDYGTEGWMPIGGDPAFTGSLDGAGHKIDGLYVKRTASVYAGLFGKVGEGAAIKSLEVNTTGATDKGVEGENRTDKQYSGILAGQNYGTIEDCHTTGKIASGAITTGNSYAGGLVGSHEGGQIRRCYSTAAVIANGAADCFAGGLVGYNAAPIDESYATTGKILIFATGTRSTAFAGGLIGNCNGGTISKCYAAGEVDSRSAGEADQLGAYAGGLMGRCGSTTVNNCYALGKVNAATFTAKNSNYTFTGGFAGRINATSPVSNCYAVGDVSSDIATNQFIGSFGGYIEAWHTRITNCYRKDGNITIRGSSRGPDDKDRIPSKSLGDMKTDAFKGVLNGSGTVWGQGGGKNSDLPYIIGVGEGK